MNYRELFKEQATDNIKFAVIFSNTFSTIYPINGCFECNGKFIVYTIDDCDHINNVKRYQNPIQAYSDLANRLDFKFDPSCYQLSVDREEYLPKALKAPINFEGNFELDCKEFFRKQLLTQHKDFYEFCVIDSSTFSKIYPIAGCFEYNGQFIVYEIDERDKLIYAMRYTNSFKAYYDLAEMLGFELELPEIDPQKDILKEKFKKELAEYEKSIGTTIDCDIDTPSFSDKPSIHGCFYDVNAWYVYSIDEKNNIFNVEKYTGCYEAYSDLAMRIGFDF